MNHQGEVVTLSLRFPTACLRYHLEVEYVACSKKLSSVFTFGFRLSFCRFSVWVHIWICRRILSTVAIQTAWLRSRYARYRSWPAAWLIMSSSSTSSVGTSLLKWSWISRYCFDSVLFFIQHLRKQLKENSTMPQHDLSAFFIYVDQSCLGRFVWLSVHLKKYLVVSGQFILFKSERRMNLYWAKKGFLWIGIDY